VTLGVFLLWRSLSLDLTWRQRGVRLAQFTAGGLLGLMIAAVQLVPLVELQQHNSRASITIAEMMAGAIPLRHIVTLLVPEFYGGPNWYYGAGNFVEFTGYIGVTSLIIGVLALLYPTLQRQSALLFFTGLTLVALHLAYGGVLNVILSLPPGYTAFRGLQRIQGVWSFGAAGMVAWGVQALLLAHGWRRQLIGSMAAGLIALGLWIVHDTEVVINLMAWLVHSPRAIRTPQLIAPFRHTAWLLVGMGAALALILWLQRYRGKIVLIAPVVLFLLIGVDLLQFNRRYLPVVAADLAYPTTPGLDYLMAQRTEGRVVRFEHTRQRAPVLVNTNIVYGLEDLQGYGSFTLERYNQIIGLIAPEKYTEVGFTNRISNFQDINVLNSPLFDLLGVAFLLVDTPLFSSGAEDSAAGLYPSVAGWVEVYSGPDMTIYRNRQALPSAWVVGDVQVQPEDPAQLAVLSNPTFDPAQQAVIAQTADQPFDPDATGTVQVVRRSLNTLELDVRVEARPGYAALLLVRQNYYPGWQARIDGASVPLLRADVNLQGVPLAAGYHRVVLTFMPSYFRTLFALALVALVGSMLLLWRNPGRRASATE
ncbi:MAG: YfhO family protein, partial [Chloroflexaceae bacterium]